MAAKAKAVPSAPSDPVARYFDAMAAALDGLDIYLRDEQSSLYRQGLIAPVAVGKYLHSVMPNSTYCLVDNVGHCPHMSAPQACAAAMQGFLAPWTATRAG